MSAVRISKRTVDSLRPKTKEYVSWDVALTGFGVRVRPSGAASYVVVYRAGTGRSAPVRRFTIGSVTKLTADQARDAAKKVLAKVAQGIDPARQKAIERGIPTFSELSATFLAEHIEPKRKARTAAFYRDIIERILDPRLGTMRADRITSSQIARLHLSLSNTPTQANRVLAAVGSIYAYAFRASLLPQAMNPAKSIEKFTEQRRERFLTTAELERLGAAVREGENIGLAWDFDEGQTNAKHIAKDPKRFSKLNPYAAAALRLLLFTGCRLREILHLRWENVDLERGVLFLSESKTGRKTVLLNPPAIAVLTGLVQLGPYVIAGHKIGQPRADLKRPWAAVTKRANLHGVRLHDIRHTYASIGAAGGLGLPVIGKLLGHAREATTARYAHLDNDPLKKASEKIAGKIDNALRGAGA